MPTKVFISDKSDDVSFAKDLARALEHRGLEVWAAFQSVSLNFAREIPQAISESSAVVLLLSRGAYTSEEVRSEVALARNDGKLLLPHVLPGEPTLVDAGIPGDFVGEWKYFLALAQYRPWISADDTAAFVAKHVPASAPTAAAAPVVESTVTSSAEAPALSPTHEFSAAQLAEVWDKITRTVSRTFGNAKLYPRQKGENGGGYRYVQLDPVTSDTPTWAAIDFCPDLIGTGHSPLRFKLHKNTPRYTDVKAAIEASEFGPMVVQEYNGIRLPLPFDPAADTGSMVEAAVAQTVAIRNAGLP